MISPTALTLPIVTPEGISPSPSPQLPAPVGGGSEGPSFGSQLGEAIGEVQRLGDVALSASEGYMAGDHQDVHGTMIAMQEADVSLRLMASVRNRAIEAYREVMRMGS